MNIIMTHPNVPESHSSSRITRPYLTSVKFFKRNNPSSIQQNAYITSSAKRQLWPSVVHLTYAIYWFAPNLKLPKVVHSAILLVLSVAIRDTAVSLALTSMTVEPPTRSAPRCKSNNLTYMIECKKCKKQYIGETKRSLRERFTEHRQATNNSDHASASAAVPTHFNLPSHSVKDMLLIPLELQVTNNPSRRKAREAYFIQRGQTLTPYGINRRNER